MLFFSGKFGSSCESHPDYCQKMGKQSLNFGVRPLSLCVVEASPFVCTDAAQIWKTDVNFMSVLIGDFLPHG